jgi:hypothetical protein
LGADALMEKPLHLPLLLKTIRNLVREPKAERLKRVIDPYFKTLLLSHSQTTVIQLPSDFTSDSIFPHGEEKYSF